MMIATPAGKVALLGGAGGPWYRNGSALANSLVAYWPLDEVSGTRRDVIGANTLTDNNTVTSNPGLVYPLAAQFTAANNESLSIVSNAALELGGSDFWIGMWFKTPAALSGAQILTNKFNSIESNSEYTLFLNGSTLTWRRFPDTFHDATIASLAINTWYFVIASFVNATLVQSLQLNNGTIATATATSANTSQSGAPVRIGGATGAYSSLLIGPVTYGKGYVPITADRTYLYNGGLGRA